MFLFFNLLSFIFQKIILHCHSFTMLKKGHMSCIPSQTDVIICCFDCLSVCVFLLLFSLILIMITILRCAECWGFCFVFVTVVFICHESLRPFCWVIYSHFFPVQMLQAAASIAPRSVYVCGNNTTTSGLTVSFVWDVSFFVCAFVFCLGLGIQDYFIIQSEKLKHGWTLTTSQYIVTHTVYFKTQRTGIEMYGWGLVMLKCVLGLVWQFYWMIWSTCPVVQIQKLPGDSTHLLYVQII